MNLRSNCPKKWVLFFMSVMLVTPSLCALGADNAPVTPMKAPQPNVEIINGKKFFSMKTARRFSGGTTPSGLLVLHHVRPGGNGTGASSRAQQLVPAKSAEATAPPALTGPGTSSSPSGATPKAQNDLLSVFAPDEKPAPPGTLPTPARATALPWATPTKQ